MTIPYFDFKRAPESLKEEWQKAISLVIDEGQFIGGSRVTHFEKEWAKYVGIEHSVGVANGYDGLVIALRAAGIKSGDLVGVPSHTFIATWLAVQAIGAIPVSLKIDHMGLLDVESLKKSDQKFNAVIPVHMHGQGVDMPELMKWAKMKSVIIIEDCAQAHGLKIAGKSVGTWGDVGVFSFYPTKNLGALVDAGIVVTNDPNIAEKSRSIGNYGSKKSDKYSYENFGVNSRLDPLQAAVLEVNLKYLDAWNLHRSEVAARYKKVLEKNGVKFLNPSNSVWHHFIVFTIDIDSAIDAFKRLKINTERHYPNTAEFNFESLGVGNVKDVLATDFCNSALSIPLNPWMGEEQIQTIIRAFNSESILLNLRKEI